MDDGFSLGVLCAMWYGRGRMFGLVRVVILASGATTIVVAIACYGDWYNHWWETMLVISVALQRLWLWSVCGGGGGGAIAGA